LHLRAVWHLLRVVVLRLLRSDLCLLLAAWHLLRVALHLLISHA
jgi:hypothetical protein